MTAPEDPQRQEPLDFDPYRFGRPEHPIPPEYAPPGYVPPPQFQVPAPPQFPQVPPPPPPYGYPPQRPGQYPGARAGHGKAVASLVLGIASIVLCWLTIFAAIPVVLAVIFGVLALRESRATPNREGRSMAIAGIACAVVGALLATALTVLIYTKFRDCLDLSPGSSQFQTCVSDHL